VRQRDGGQPDLEDVGAVVGERLEHGPEAVEVAVLEALLQRGAREFEAARAQVGHGGQRLDRHRPPGDSLDGLQHAVLARLGQRDRHALAAGAAHPPGPVHVGLGRGRHVVVDDVREQLDVEAAGGDVGGHEQLGGAGAQPPHHPLALLLGHAAVERLGAVAAAVQGLGQLVDLGAGAAEHERRVGLLEVEDAAERRGLGRPVDHVGDLADARRLAGRGLVGGELQADGVAQVALDDRAEAGRERRREEHGLALGGGRVEDRLEVLGEAHVEHLVGLVEHHGAQAVQPQRAAFEVVAGAAGRRDDDVDAAREHLDLAAERLPAVDGGDACAQVAAIAVHRLRDLGGQLARGDEHERLRVAAVAARGQPLQERERERRGLAGPRRGLAEQVAAGEQGRDRLALHGRWLLVAERGEGLEQFGSEAEVGERGGGLVGHATTVGRTCRGRRLPGR